MFEQMEFLHDAAPIVNKYKRRIDGVVKTVGNLTDYEAASLAILLDNTEKQLLRYKRAKNLSDDSFSTDVGPFIRHALNIVSFLYTTLELKDIVSIQPLKQKIGALYFMNYKYANTKGNVAANAYIGGPAHAPTRTGYYSSQFVKLETVTGATYDGDADTYSFTLNYIPVITDSLLSIVVTGGGNAAGTWTWSTGTTLVNGNYTGTIDPDTGEVVLGSVTAAVTGCVASYMWASEKNRDLTPKVTIGVEEVLCVAQRRALLFDVSLDATIDYENQFGSSLNTDIEASIIREIQNELCYYVLEEMMAGCYSSTVYEWSETRPENISIYDHYQSLSKVLSEMSTQLFKNYGRGRGTYIVGGSDFQQHCSTMPNTMFEAAPIDDIRGPHFIGTLLGKYKVYFNPAYADDKFIMGYKGKDWWEAAYFIGSYLPLMSTKFMMFPDMHGEQGYISMDAYKYLFPNHVVKGTITA